MNNNIKTPSLSVVIPVFNEHKTIEQVLCSLKTGITTDKDGVFILLFIVSYKSFMKVKNPKLLFLDIFLII